jgi:hypothetical protein
MIRSHRLLRTTWSLAAAFVLALMLAVPASASVSTEQQEGARILSAIHAGKLKGTSLSSSQYEHVGEYLMGQALGSTAAHERMNSLADQMMGSTAVDQMHVYLGARYLGKSTGQISGRYAPMYGLIGMMTGYRGSSIAGMMSGYLNSQSQGTAPNTIGPGMMGYGIGTSANSSSSWPTGAIIAVAILAALLIGGALALALHRLRGRGHPGRPADSPLG